MSLPLPLAPFEEYMLFDDPPTHPMSFFIRLKLTGHCNASVLDTALRQVLSRHPLLSATAQKVSGNRFDWHPLDTSTASVHWETESADSDETHPAYLDLSKRSGLEVFGSQTEGATELLFQFHHACCDALGGLELIEDVLVDYANDISDPPLPELQASSGKCPLRNRAKFGLTRWDLFRIAPKQLVGLLGARKFLVHTPAPLIPVEPANLKLPLPKQYPTSVQHQFSSDETQAIITAAKASRTTVNNLLASDLFISIQQFREQQRIAHPCRWIRLSVPVNLRRPGAECDSAVNTVSMVFLDRRPKVIKNRNHLLATIHREMSCIKKLDLGLTFPLSLRLLKPLGVVTRMTDDEQCRCTAVLSNLLRPLADSCLPRQGEKIIVGNLQLDEICLLPPVRPKTISAFGVLTYAGRLGVTQHYDSRAISTNDAQQLLNIYVEQILASAMSPTISSADD